MGDLIVLCEKCHSKFHDKENTESDEVKENKDINN